MKLDQNEILHRNSRICSYWQLDIDIHMLHQIIIRGGIIHCCGLDRRGASVTHILGVSHSKVFSFIVGSGGPHFGIGNRDSRGPDDLCWVVELK